MPLEMFFDHPIGSLLPFSLSGKCSPVSDQVTGAKIALPIEIKRNYKLI
jgi:hypothetical protein